MKVGMDPRWLWLLLVWILLVPVHGLAEDAPGAVPKEAWRALDRAVSEIARSGWAEETEELLTLMGRLGPDAEALERSRKSAIRQLKRAKRRAAPPLKRAVTRLRDATTALTGHLGDLPDEPKLRVAQVIVLLDDQAGTAQALLGRVEHEGRWVEPHVPALEARRTAVAGVLRAARHLDVPIEHGTSRLPVFPEVMGREGITVRWKQIHLHSSFHAPGQLERILREAVRAAAVSRYLLTGTLELPTFEEEEVFAFLSSEADYARYVDLSAAAGRIPANEVDWTKQTSAFWDTRGFSTGFFRTETITQAHVFQELVKRQVVHLFDARGEVCLEVGHINWICLSYLGCPMLGSAYREVEETVREGRTGSDADRVLREQHLRLSGAGMAGTRAWLTFLAERGEDPPWSGAMQDHWGKVIGDDRVKTTVVVEYLHEMGEFVDLLRETRQGTSRGPDGTPGAIATALGEGIDAFQARWRRWLIPRPPSLVQRLGGGGGGAAADPAATAVLKSLVERRVNPPEHGGYTRISVDPDLSRGCRAHARYLALHPEQQQAWPDAHEEYADREGFSPVGCLAGLHSVIVSGIQSPEEAIEAWMGTFFHRVPLLDPRVVRIGWALVDGIAVLDIHSMRRHHQVKAWQVYWPPREARDVPRRFRPELPNPFPGQDQSRWGHPITLQVSRRYLPCPGLGMTLHEGASSSAPEVPCLFTSPEKPGNPEHVPNDTWCLIPKAHLKSKTTYTVRLEGTHAMPVSEWSFTTGR